MLTLYGGRRSPFARRVEVWLLIQGRAFDRRYVDVFGNDFEAFKAISPLGRVPALTIAPDEHLIETAAIIDSLEDTASPQVRLIPPTGDERCRCQSRIAYANAVAEKGVAFVYETERRPPQYQWSEWRDRLSDQVQSGLAALEAKVPAAGWLGGMNLDGSDIAAICAYDFVAGIDQLGQRDRYPRLAALSVEANQRSAFSATYPVGRRSAV